MAPSEEIPSSEESPSPRGWRASLVAELRENPVTYAVLLLFVVAGPIVTHQLFPDAPRGVGLFGGLALGGYACLCAMPGRFF